MDQAPASDRFEDGKRTGTDQDQSRPDWSAGQGRAQNDQNGTQDPAHQATLVTDVAIEEPAHDIIGRA